MNEMISESEFDNVWGAHAKENGELFTYDEVKGLPLNTVWSIVEGEDGSWIASPGFHVVNMMGYVLTTKPWEDELLDAMWFPSDFDEEDREEHDEVGVVAEE